MAKITITLEDRRDDSGKTTVAVDMSGVPIGMEARLNPSPACFISNTLFAMASCEQILGSLAACRVHPQHRTIQ